jgi:neutral ceramidase
LRIDYLYIVNFDSAPGGDLDYTLYQLAHNGFILEKAEQVIEGIYQSIIMAHKNLSEGKIRLSKGTLLDANINRSPSAYESNPSSERSQYSYNVDKEMTLLRLSLLDGMDIGSVNWFPVHCTSMNNTNGYVSGDNKGYASYLFERVMNEPGPSQAPKKFTAAFAQSNEVSK